MGRRPKLRASYYDDAQFLLRLGKAVLDDSSRPEQWRRDIDCRIRELVSLLTREPSHVES